MNPKDSRRLAQKMNIYIENVYDDCLDRNLDSKDFDVTIRQAYKLLDNLKDWLFVNSIKSLDDIPERFNPIIRTKIDS